MALSKETQEWLEGLKKEGSLTDEAYNQLKTSLEANAKADEYVKGSQLRQADYSRVMSDVQKAQKAVEDSQAALATREAQVTKYQGDLAQWKDGADRNFQKAIQERELAANKAQAAIARLKSLAVANGLPEDEVLKDLDTVVPQKKEDVNTPQFDTSKFVTRDQIAQTVAESALIDASIHDVAAEYFELTGKPLRDASKLVQEAIVAKKPIGAYAAEKFGFAKLKEDRTNADIQKRIDDAVAAERTKILSDAGLPNAGTGLRTDLKGSPIFEKASNGSLPIPKEDTGGGIPGAIAAFNAGKFRTGGNR